jgi:hypothetical protein
VIPVRGLNKEPCVLVAVNGVTRYTLQYKARVFATRGGALPATEAVPFFCVNVSHVNGFCDQDNNYENR